MMQRPASLQISKKRVTLFAIIVLSFFSLIYTPVREELMRLVYPFASGVFYLGNKTAGIGNALVNNFRDKNALVYENSMLRAQNSLLQAEVLDRSVLQGQIAQLEGTLGRSKNNNLVVANVLAGFSQSPYDTLTIDVGTNQGIKNGDYVAYGGVGVVGYIAEATETYSKVKLYSSPGEEYLVLIGSHLIPATARGKGDGNFDAKVPQGSMIIVGDVVTVPKDNLVLGRVTAINQKEGAPYATVLFRSSFNPTEVQTVEVVTGTH